MSANEGPVMGSALPFTSGIVDCRYCEPTPSVNTPWSTLAVLIVFA